MLLALGLLLAASPADAALRPCVHGKQRPLCHSWKAKVTSVGDGDTVDVKLVRDGARRRHVRVIGIQAMELTRYASNPRNWRGKCHARAAAMRMRGLVYRRHVRLLAQSPRSRTAKRKRLRRALLVRQDGRWVDPARILLREGHALWLPNGHEWAWNRPYRKTAKRAARRGVRIYDRSHCGGGARSAKAVRLKLRFDARGSDAVNVRGEFARVRNVGRRLLRLGGWHFRDSALRRYRLPRGTRLRPGASLKIHVGKGVADADDLFWGLSAPIFENPSHNRRATGDGAYLFDRDGDLRAWKIYP